MKLRLVATVALLGISSMACSGPSGQEDYDLYSKQAAEIGKKLSGLSTSEVQERIWKLGEEGKPFQAKLDSLKQRVTGLNEQLAKASTAASDALAKKDAQQVKSARASSEGLSAEVDKLAGEIGALDNEVVAVTNALPSSIAMSELPKVDMGRLQRIFAKAGWEKPGAAVGTMVSSGYEYSNFDVAKGSVVLNVSVIRPSPDKSGKGGAAPKGVAEQAAKDSKVFVFDAATDTYVEIVAKDGASPADAKALLGAVIKT